MLVEENELANKLSEENELANKLSEENELANKLSEERWLGGCAPMGFFDDSSDEEA
eukprot:COSAG02_NODE_22470_length_751_cov_2.306748_1_plen_55_part_01